MRKKKDDEVGLFQQFVSQLPRTLGYVREYFGELLGSIILSACWVWFEVCIMVIHNQGNTGREGGGHEFFFTFLHLCTRK